MSPDPPDRVFETSVLVRSYELDAFAHVNHAVYLSYLEHARFQALEAAGFPLEEVLARGWGVYVVRVEVDYLKEARMDDELTIRTWAAEARRSSLLLSQEVRRGDDLVARALVTAVWVGPERKAIRVPDEVRVAFGLAP